MPMYGAIIHYECRPQDVQGLHRRSKVSGTKAVSFYCKRPLRDCQAMYPLTVGGQYAVILAFSNAIVHYNRAPLVFSVIMRFVFLLLTANSSRKAQVTIIET